MTPSTIRHALSPSRTRGVDRLDAQWLLLHVLGRRPTDRSWLVTHDDVMLTAVQADVYNALLHRRASGEPLAYLVGYKEFFGLELQVDARVLVPRPDTETLVHWALDMLAECVPADGGSVDVIDLGTGSGAVALSLAHGFQTRDQAARILAVDASLDALAVASANALKLGLAVEFTHSNWLSKVSGRFHLIASNPPYVAQTDAHLAALHHEPLSALASGTDGLDDLRAIIAQSPPHMLDGGWLLLEHGYNQAGAVRDLLQQAGFVQLSTRLDLSGVTRCSGGQWLRPPSQPNSEIIRAA